MKKNIHPEYRTVLFVDQTNGGWFLIPSSVSTKEKGVCEGDGQEYPLVRLPITSLSHRHWTGGTQFLDTEGRIDKFSKKYQRKFEQQASGLARQEEANKEKVKAAKKKK